ncbi:MAG: efflux RND transporter periplasmic adaptor subunit [Phycisphaerales bacterium]|nr:efflux RND transporter periplasmic adaptor subunit [Phycisphaerales bacterium]
MFILLISISIVSVLASSKPQLEIATGERALPAVIVMEAEVAAVERRTVGYGSADPLQHADVPARVASTVEAIPATTKIGQFVKKGELLLSLDTSDFRQQLIKAEQALASSRAQQAMLSVEQEAATMRATLAKEDQVLAEAELSRIQEAFDQGAAKQREVDAAKQRTIGTTSKAVNAQEAADRFPALEEQLASTIASNASDVALAKENVRRCNILSPIDGVIQGLDVRVGEHVQSGQRVVRVVDSGSLEIPLRLPSHTRAFVALGDEVALRSAGFGKRHWDARVSRIAPEDDTQTRTMIVYIDIEQDAASPTRVPPGLFVRGVVKHAQNIQSRWVVPRRSIREDRIFIVRDSTLRSFPVSIDFSITGALHQFGLPDHDWVVLETPLETGDEVVVDPGGSLRDGMKVRVVRANEVAL